MMTCESRKTPFFLFTSLFIVLLLAGPTSVRADIQIDNPGTTDKTGKTKCPGHVGDVTAAVGVQSHVTVTMNPKPAVEVEQTVRFKNMLSLAYKGQGCAACKWYQFVWREKLITHTGKPEAPATGPVSTSGGSYNYTDNPAQPNYNADAGAHDPAYEGDDGAALRTPDSTTIYDQPSSSFTEAEKADGTIASMREIAHFNAFLICAKKVCAKISWTVTYTWSPGPGGGTEAGPKYDVSAPDLSGNPPNDAQQHEWDARFPGQNPLK